MVRRIAFVALALLLVAGAWLAGLLLGLYGSHQGPGEITMRSGFMRRICASVISSLRRTSSFAPKEPSS